LWRALKLDTHAYFISPLSERTAQRPTAAGLNGTITAASKPCFCGKWIRSNVLLIVQEIKPLPADVENMVSS
jgi:hypothetical protein